MTCDLEVVANENARYITLTNHFWFLLVKVEMETADETADGAGAGTQAQEQAAQEDQGEVGKIT